jgi:hypothetical protein
MVPNDKFRYLKCRFCDYRVKKWSTAKGQSKSGLPRLLHHIEVSHGMDTSRVLDGGAQ